VGEGDRLGPYTLREFLGAGGMGEVFRSTDERLGRDVAVKVLAPGASQDPGRLSRFEQEARSVAALSHPNIVSIYDVGSAGGISFAVMELLEGESLGARLGRGALPLRTAIEYAVRIAEGLAAAHRRGIIHRDLKPDNLFVTRDGRVKILDFGLAKLRPALDEGPRSEERTATEIGGAALGTIGYMSPEQVEGKSADGRSDLFSLGCVLYEMLSGRRAFKAETPGATMASILRDDPRSLANFEVPLAVAHVVRHCLEKRPEDRFQSAQDLAFHLEALLAADGPQDAEPEPPRRTRVLPRAAALGAALLLLLGAVSLRYRPVAAAPGPVRSSIVPARGLSLGAHAHLAVSPDGSHIAFVGCDLGGRSRLWVRKLSELEGRPLPGTEGATYPFWSPDSRALGFFAEGELRRIGLSGGPVETLAQASQGRGGTWGPDGTILFAPHIEGPIYRVSVDGLGLAPVTRFSSERGESSHRWPSFLPDGRHFLYVDAFNRADTAGVYLASLDSPETRLLVATDSNALYAPSGHILFTRQGSLMAQPFDAARLEVTGAPVPIAERISYRGEYLLADFSASSNGLLVYRGDTSAPGHLAWFDRQGRRIATLPEIHSYRDGDVPSLSPDGQHFAMTLWDSRTQAGDLWLYEGRLATGRRFTFEPGPCERGGVFSPDGRSLTYAGGRGSLSNVYRKDTSGVVPETLLLSSSVPAVPTGFSPDGRYLLYQAFGEESDWDLFVLPLFGDAKPRPFLQTHFDEHGAVFSPSGRYVAYASNESGRYEVYVRPFPGPGAPTRVSIEGGDQLGWRSDGRELYYLSLDRKLMAADVQEEGGLRIGPAKPLWDASLRSLPVTNDGQRFLTTEREETGEQPITLVVDWSRSLPG
jgi:Tol biopolymer transport system component